MNTEAKPHLQICRLMTKRRYGWAKEIFFGLGSAVMWLMLAWTFLHVVMVAFQTPVIPQGDEDITIYFITPSEPPPH